MNHEQITEIGLREKKAVPQSPSIPRGILLVSSLNQKRRSSFFGRLSITLGLRRHSYNSLKAILFQCRRHLVSLSRKESKGENRKNLWSDLEFLIEEFLMHGGSAKKLVDQIDYTESEDVMTLYLELVKRSNQALREGRRSRFLTLITCLFFIGLALVFSLPFFLYGQLSFFGPIAF